MSFQGLKFSHFEAEHLKIYSAWKFIKHKSDININVCFIKHLSCPVEIQKVPEIFAVITNLRFRD